MPALLTSASIDLKRDSAVSTILAAVAGSPMWPSTRATWLEAATSVDWVIFRELATTLKPRSTSPFTIPAPIPCEAPVTIAVFSEPLMVVHLSLLMDGSALRIRRAFRPDSPRCLVLDVRLPGLSGLDLQHELANTDPPIPIVFITAHGDIPMTVQALKAGAVDFLTKPFRDQPLLNAVWQAIDRDRAARRRWADLAELRRRCESLTQREREVMTLVVTGLLNKQIAARLR